MIYKNAIPLKQVSEPTTVAGVKYIEAESTTLGRVTLTQSAFNLNQFLNLNNDEKLGNVRAELVKLIDAYITESRMEDEIE